jgi:hypothetical protein
MDKFNEMPASRAVLACTAVGLMALAGCSDQAPDYDGLGNTFEIRGIIDDVDNDGEIYINEDELVVDAAAGIAINWFPNREGQNLFSDDFNFKAAYSREPADFLSCGHEETVGRIVMGVNGQVISPEQLQKGSEVKVTGRIRDTRYWLQIGKTGHCTEKFIATYETVEVTRRPLNR